MAIGSSLGLDIIKTLGGSTATHISLARVAAQPLDANMAAGGSPGPRHPCGLWCVSTDSGCCRTRDPDMARGWSSGPDLTLTSSVLPLTTAQELFRFFPFSLPFLHCSLWWHLPTPRSQDSGWSLWRPSASPTARAQTGSWVFHLPEPYSTRKTPVAKSYGSVFPPEVLSSQMTIGCVTLTMN